MTDINKMGRVGKLNNSKKQYASTQNGCKKQKIYKKQEKMKI